MRLSMRAYIGASPDVEVVSPADELSDNDKASAEVPAAEDIATDLENLMDEADTGAVHLGD